MGSGIAQVTAMCGFEVIVSDLNKTPSDILPSSGDQDPALRLPEKELRADSGESRPIAGRP